MEDCIFCKIVKGDLPSTREFEDANCLVIKNINPISETHLLVIPKKHIDTFVDLDGEMMSILTKAAQQTVKDKSLQEGYKLVINGGKYQVIKHVHLHLLAGKLEKEDDILNNT